MLSHPMPAAAVVVEDLDDDVCLYRSDTDEVLVLNTSAGDVWRLADGSRSGDDIAAQLATAYGLEPGTVDPDVRQTLADLTARGFLVESVDQP